MTAPPRDASSRLDSWKAIADYLHRTVRTVQRWERSFGLPVHRHAHHSAATIYAYRDELDAWFDSRRQELTTGDGGDHGEPVGLSTPDATCTRRVVVLPFADLSPDGGETYLCSGIVEELTCALTGLASLHVSAPGAVLAEVRRSGTEEAPRTLNADLVVDGSVRRLDGRLRLTARVTDRAGGQVLSSFHLDGTLSQTLAMQELLARRVLLALQVPIGDDAMPVRRHSLEVDAYELFLRSRHAWNTRTPASLRDSIALARQAIARDPDYALAHAALAVGEVTLAAIAIESPLVAMERARQAAERALALDDTVPEAWAALGCVHVLFDWDARAAADAFTRALALMPQHATTWQWYSHVHLANGDLDQAVEALRHAEALDPTSCIIKTHLGWMLYLARRYEDALSACARALRYDPRFSRAYFNAALVYAQQGRPHEALRAIETCVVLSDYPTYRAVLARFQAEVGDIEGARTTLDGLRAGEHFVSEYFVAMALLGLGEPESAMVQLRVALERREWFLLLARFEPRFDEIRGERDFRTLLARVEPALARSPVHRAGGPRGAGAGADRRSALVPTVPR